MSKVSVDVLVTFYNQEKYVDDALRSVLSQKGDFSLRVLIGDDGSTDSTPELLRKWREQYPDQIKIFSMVRKEGEKLPGGFRAARNRLKLLKYVNSDYFIFLDGDDFFDNPEKLKKQVDILEDEKNRDCIACGHAIDALHEDGTRRPFSRLCTYKDKYSLKEYWPATYFHTNTILFRREAISVLPDELPEDIFNDNGITYLFLHKGKIYYIPEVMAIYRQTGDGIWTGEKMITSLIREMMFYDYIIQHDHKIRYETRVRFWGVWEKLFLLRKELSPNRLEIYLSEAKKNDFKYTQLWINYKRLSINKKAILFKEFLIIPTSKSLYKLCYQE